MEDFIIKTKPRNTVAIRKTLRLYLHLITKGWRYTIPVTLAVAIGSTLIFYIPPLIIASLINSSRTITLENSWQLLLLFGVSWLIGEALWRIAMYLMIRFESGVIERLYKDSLNVLLQKELSFYANHFTGTITKNLLAYARRFESFFDTIVFEVISQLVPALFAAVILWFISPWLAVALFGMVAFGAIVIIPLIRKRLMLVKAREDAHSTMAGHVADVITNIGAIKAFGSEDAEHATHKKLTDNFLDKAKRSWHYQNSHIDMVVSPIYVATNVLGLAIILSLGVDPATKATLFIGYSYYANVTRFMWSFSSVYRRLEESIADASLFIEYTLANPKVIDVPNASRLSVASGKIAFNAMEFTHGENTDPLFTDFSLTIPAGQKIGLVGHSGAGKSTISSLLLRFMDIDGGSIEIDGQSISKVTQKSLHESIAYVPQEPLLFHRSLRENIAYGKPSATDDEITEAAIKANAYDFIKSLPKGYDTLVGERGVKLSGGQRQRIAIARAILKDAPILVLDEATSALDSESEKLIQDALQKLMKGRTSIVIAHRLSTIAKLDRIIVLDNGKIIEDGTHAELLQKKGTYAKLWSHQSGGFIEE